MPSTMLSSIQLEKLAAGGIELGERKPDAFPEMLNFFVDAAAGTWLSKQGLYWRLRRIHDVMIRNNRILAGLHVPWTMGDDIRTEPFKREYGWNEVVNYSVLRYRTFTSSLETTLVFDVRDFKDHLGIHKQIDGTVIIFQEAFGFKVVPYNISPGYDSADKMVYEGPRVFKKRQNCRGGPLRATLQKAMLNNRISRFEVVLADIKLAETNISGNENFYNEP